MKGTMKLIEKSTGLMECKVCGSRHIANLQSRPGKFPAYHRGSWICVNGCKK